MNFKYSGHMKTGFAGISQNRSRPHPALAPWHESTEPESAASRPMPGHVTFPREQTTPCPMQKPQKTDVLKVLKARAVLTILCGMRYDYLIVGSGLFGATFAHCAAKAGKTCLVLEKRAHTGGNVHCDNVSEITVHTYGAHIFHTSNEEVWRFVNDLVPFVPFVNSPVAKCHGKLYNLPFNMNTFYQLWGCTSPHEAADIIERQRKDCAVREPRNLEEQALSLVGRDIYETLIRDYTEKQWGRPCTELPAFIIKRLPVRFTFDNNYFNDTFQGIPKGGYNHLVDALLKGIQVQTCTDFFSDREKWQNMAGTVVYTGMIDEFYGFRFGHLEWRSVRFETETVPTQNFQGVAVVNYTSHEQPFTRIIEHKHFEPGAGTFPLDKTVVSREYSSGWKPGAEPFYPVNDERNNALYRKYEALAEKEPHVIFGGRLAEYRYYDMDDVVERSLACFKNIKSARS